MGTGKSPANRAANTVTTLTISPKETIDLTGSPLVYGKDDAGLQGAARTAIEAFEQKRKGAKIEFSTFVMDDGTVIENNRGGKGSVGASLYARNKADVMSHNHPRREGIIGGTFSDADLSNFGKFNQHTIRATAKEGTYSMTKGKNFHGRSLVKDYKIQTALFEAAAGAEVNKLNNDVKTGKISYKKYLAEMNAVNNKMLIQGHNFLLANQKKYDYTYQLERSK